MLETGMIVPAFTIPTDTGSFSMAENTGKNVVVFFFPRADTGSCTKEAVAFSGLLDDFAAANAAVIGISKDTAAKQAKFRAKHGLTVELASGSKNQCMERPIWVSSAPVSSSDRTARSPLSGRR